MRAFFAHLGKEFRDQRAIVIAVAACLPVLTLLAFWAFTGHIVEAPLRTAVPVFVPLALVLYLFAFGGDLFASDARRGTLAFLRRQPGGLAHAFRAKVLVFLLGFGAVVFWQSGILAAAWALWGRSAPATYGHILRSAWISPVTWSVLCVGMWVLLASVWLKRGGIAVLLAPLLLGAIVVPAVAWLRANPIYGSYLVPKPKHAWPVLVLASFAVALSAAAWSYLGGRRFARSAWSAVWRGLVVVCVVAGGAYAFAAAKVYESQKLSPESKGFRIWQAHASPDGSRLYLDVRRVSPGGDDLTPTRAWMVDVETGDWEAVGAWGESFDAPRLGGMWYWSGAWGGTIEPQPRLILYRARRGGDEPVHSWIDVSTGEILKTVVASVRTPDIRAWSREAGRVATWVRDARGRRVWLEAGTQDPLLYREGLEAGTRLDGPPGWFHHPIPGGWVGWERNTSHRPIVLDATDARVTRTHPTVRGMAHSALAPDRALLRAVRGEGGEREHSGWVLADLETGERTVLEGSSSDIAVVMVLDRHCVLGLTGTTPKHLVLWDPEGATLEDLAWPPRAGRFGITNLRAMGRDADGVLAFTVECEGKWHAALLDPRTRKLTPLADDRSEMPSVFALLDDGAALAVEGGTRIVRYGPESGARAVLFPR